MNQHAFVPCTLGIISDIHIKEEDADAAANFRSALFQLAAKAAQTGASLDGILAVGALANNMRSEQIRIFKNIYEEIFNPEKVPLIHCYGDDHDLVWSDPHAADIIREYTEIFGESYYQYDIDPSAIPDGNRHAVIKGYHILALEPAGRRPIVYSDKTKKWLAENLAALTRSEPEKFVIVITHPMIANTVYGSELGGGAWATEYLTDILSKYPQAVVFSGHLHFPLNDPRSIMQTDFTAVGTGAARYLGVETDGFAKPAAPCPVPDSFQLSQGLLMQLSPTGDMTLTRMDFKKQAEIGEKWMVPHPGNDRSHLSVYTRARADEKHNKPPVLHGFSVEFLPGNAQERRDAVIRFPAGTDDEFVHHYIIEYGETDGEKKHRRIVTDFYSSPSPSDMKKDWELIIPDFACGAAYVFTLTAYDSWDAASEPLKTETVCR